MVYFFDGCPDQMWVGSIFSLMRRLRALSYLLVSLLTAFLITGCLVTGCAVTTPRNALPQAAAQVQPDGSRHVRYWADARTA